MSSQNSGYILLTGATGLLGQYLVRDLLAEGQQVAVVVRSSKQASARQRVENFMQRWEAEAGCALPRPVVLEGDVCQQSLGLSDADVDWVARRCDRVVHSAAVLTFYGSSMDRDPWRTNLGGTQNVLDLCQRTGIGQLHYMSTAYVCGKRTDRVYENELETGQSFRNDYEKCKYEAERLVRAAEFIPSRTIYRPAVIAGDSRTGFTATYHGLFMYLRLLATLVPRQKRNAEGVIQTPIQAPLSGDEPRNVVTVDWVSKVSCRLMLEPGAHGQTFHIAPDKCSTARQVIGYCCEYFNSAGVEFVGADAEPETSEFSSMFFENASLYRDYEKDDPEFDKTNLNQFAGDIKCPEIDREMVLRFLEFGTANHWGKRRETSAPVAWWLDQEIDRIAIATNALLDDLPAGTQLGLNLLGPGGGQLQLMKTATGEMVVDRGLPTADQRIICATTLDLTPHAAENAGPDWSALFGARQLDYARI